MSLETQIKDLAAGIGYAACGIADSEPFDEFRAAVERHMRRDPEAAALYADCLKRADPRAAASWARSIVVCIRRYGKYAVPAGLDRHIGRNYLFDRRHAACPDHDMPKRMKDGLRGLGLRVKTGGVPSRAAAARAGVGRIGRNCFCYTAHGSWVNIEAWLVDAELQADAPAAGTPCPDGCRACLDACPTKALAAPFDMRMERCVAYLSYAAPEPLPPELRDAMGPWIYGCDACQNACPLNRGKWEPLEPAPWIDAAADRLTPAALAGMSEADYRAIVHPLFWYIPEDNLARWHANARRALQNHQPSNHSPSHGH